MLQTTTLSPSALDEDSLETIGLHYVTDTMPGISRKKAGKGFYYLDQFGKKITDKKIIQRITALRIPPAWHTVWISTSTHGHIQAIGVDEKNRKQYLYHPEWIAISQQHKFDKLLFFSSVLPEMRKKISLDMQLAVLNRERVLATIIWLLENTYIRIGNTEYAKTNKSFGLTTLRTNHIQAKDNSVLFAFKGKSGVMHSVAVEHPRVVRTIRKLEELPGYELFQYINDDGKRHLVDSRDVNDYLKALTGEHVTAKDFRTWGGTVLSAVTLHQLGDFETKKQAKKNLTQAVRTVSKHLRNTPAVCRSYYIHPVVLQTYEEHVLIPHFQKPLTKKIAKLTNDEIKVKELLARYGKNVS